MEYKFSLLPAQMALIKCRKPVGIFVGGMGSGKSHGGVCKAVHLGSENPPECVGMYIEPTYAMIRDVAIRSFQKVLGEAEIPYVFHKSDNIFRILDSFDVLFRSGDQPERLVGINAAWAIIDEPATQSEDVAKMVLSRLRDPHATLRQLILTGTPTGFNWFYEWTMRSDCEVIRATTYDNPHLDQEYIANMALHYTEQEVSAYIRGEFVRFSGAWFPVIPPLRPYSTTPSGIKVFREPSLCSTQIVVGADSAGGLGRDRSAVAVVDKRDSCLVASWVSPFATLREMCDIIEELDRLYSRESAPLMPPYFRAPAPSRPLIVVEVDGIGRATWQMLAERPSALQIVELKTKEHTRYTGLLAVRRAVEAQVICGPEELQEEARDLVAEDQKFRGKKDLSMAIGFCLNHITHYPYTQPTHELNPNQLRLMDHLKPRHHGW